MKEIKTKTKRKKKERLEKYEALREIYRHYIDFQDFYLRTGQHIIENVPIVNKDGSVAYTINISFLDLKTDLNKLTKRKKEAFLYCVIYDMRQKDAARLMGIRGVTAGQYVSSSTKELSKRYFAEEIN